MFVIFVLILVYACLCHGVVLDTLKPEILAGTKFSIFSERGQFR